MNSVIRDMIDVFFKLLVEAVNSEDGVNQRIYFYKFQGILEALYYAQILTLEEQEYLYNASWEVYFNGNNKIFSKSEQKDFFLE